MTRLEAVKAAIRKFEDEPFTYGRFDCCEFVREVATLYRGADPAPELVYMNEAEAEHLIADFGGLSSLMTYVFGDPIKPEASDVGDALLLKLPKVGEIMGVCVPDGALVPVMRGLHKIPSRYVLEGWRI